MNKSNRKPKPYNSPDPSKHKKPGRAYSSELLFLGLLDSAPDGIVVVDGDGRIVLVNAQAEKLFGYSRNELLGMPVEILVPERFLERHARHRKEYVAQSRARPMGSGLDLTGRRKDATEFPVEVSLSSMKTREGPLVIAVIRDVTSRKRIEAAIQQVVEGTASAIDEQFFRSLVKHLANALHVRWAFVSELADEKGRRLRLMAFWNSTGHGETFEYDTQGTPCEKVVGKQLVYYPAKVQELFPQDVLLKELGVESYLAIPLFDSAGKPIGHLGVMHEGPMNDTLPMEAILKIFAARAGSEMERRRAEHRIKKLNRELEQRVAERTAELRDERDRTQTYLNLVGAIIVVIDALQRVTLINQKGCELLGYEEEEIVGKNWFDVFIPERIRDEVRAAFAKLIAGEIDPVEYYENPVLTRNGEERIILWHNSVLKDRNGKIHSTVSSGLDITEKLQLEQQVRQAEKLAAVGQLTAGLAHEIGTPLNVIMGRAEYMLRKMPAEEPLRENLQSIVGQIERITRIVQQLLTFARPKPLQVQTVGLASMLEGVLMLFQHQIAKQGIAAQIDCSRELPEILVDPDQIQQVLFNIIMNAIQAMPQGGDLKLRVCQTTSRKGREDPVKDRYLKIEIADTGDGISPEKLSRIFDPFFSTKDVGKGAGLGLTVSYGIIKRHGGWIDVKSRIGDGSVFTLYLPLHVPQIETAQLGEKVHG